MCQLIGKSTIYKGSIVGFWMSQYSQGETIAIDGKSITNTFKNNSDGKQAQGYRI